MRKSTIQHQAAKFLPLQLRATPALVGATLALCSMAASAANVILTNSPFSGMLATASIQPATHRGINVEGATVGINRTATAGDNLLEVHYIPTTQLPSVVITQDLSLSTGDATLNLKTGDKVIPGARIRDVSGETYFLVKTDPQTSSFLKKDRYFALAEDGSVLNRTFSTLSDTYLTREEVTVAKGSFTLSLTKKTDATLCGLSVVYLGQSEGTLKFKLIRSDANGAVNAELVRSFATGVKAVALPGAQLGISKADAKAIRARVDGLPLINCNGEL
ncbi:hypothetical protein [Chromobacterium haemolyticum]|nr:hypothetical protein [Chromobacterium haemolyticum]